MSGKIEIEWFSYGDKQHPDKPGKERYEQIECLVQRKGRRWLEKLYWNCEHLVWDDSDGDDFECHACDVIAWAIIHSTFIKP